MPSKASLLALGIGAYLAFAIAGLPATHAYRWFAPEALRLSGISGTLWDGAAALGEIGGLSVADVEWRLEPLTLLTGRLGGTLAARLPDGFLSTDFTATTTRVSLRDLRAGTSLESLRNLFPIYGTQGEASVILDRLELVDGWPVTLLGELRVGQLRVAPLLPAEGQTMIELGDYRARFVEQPEPGLLATLDDISGPLELEGSIRLDPDRSYALEGLVRARPEASDSLVQGLAIMTAEPDASGRRAFAFTGSL